MQSMPIFCFDIANPFVSSIILLRLHILMHYSQISSAIQNKVLVLQFQLTTWEKTDRTFVQTDWIISSVDWSNSAIDQGSVTVN